MQCVGTDEENVEFLIHFEDILAFTTGAPREPPLGYDPSLHSKNDSMYFIPKVCSV